jgi:WD repeat-containing protein 48
MAPVPAARRISYVIPPPSSPRTRLVLPTLDTPRRGRTVPLVIPYNVPLDSNEPTHRANPEHFHRPSSSVSSAGSSPPQHRLGVSALAIDISTILAGKSSPEGILYSAGRDGLVLAWDIGAPTRPGSRKARGRVPATKSHRTGEWKAMTGWDEDEDDAESSETDSDDASVPELGDLILDDVDDEPLLAGSRPHRDTLDKSIPCEKRWEVDGDRLNDTEIVCIYYIISLYFLSYTPLLALFVSSRCTVTQ